jgi:hypothetical protein
MLGVSPSVPRGFRRRHSGCTTHVVRWGRRTTEHAGNAAYGGARPAQVTVYYFTWIDRHSGTAVHAARPATVSAILAAGGEPIVDSAHQIPAAEINEVGVMRGATFGCDICGAPLEDQGMAFTGYAPQPRPDQIFKCPHGHQVWTFVDPLREWRRRWAAPTTTAAAT